jgi:hypothetical protein
LRRLLDAHISLGLHLPPQISGYVGVRAALLGATKNAANSNSDSPLAFQSGRDAAPNYRRTVGRCWAGLDSGDVETAGLLDPEPLTSSWLHAAHVVGNSLVLLASAASMYSAEVATAALTDLACGIVATVRHLAGSPAHSPVQAKVTPAPVVPADAVSA